jgi:hypothetical protein
MRLRACLLAIAVVMPLRAFAQTPPPADAPPPAAPAAPEAVPATPPPPPVVVVPPADPIAVVAPAPMAPAPVVAAPGWKDLVVVDGLVDAYYQYLITGPTSLTGPVNRQFDVNSNTFTLNYAKVGIGIDANPVGFRLDMGYGATGAIINSALASDATSSPSANTVGPMVISNPFIVQQAYATVSPIKGLTIDFGKFVTTAGAEVIEANKNWLYSRSILFFNIPLLHTGLRVGYKVNDMVSLQASVVNGWNGVGINPDITADKTFGLSIGITAPTGTTIAATGYFGKGEGGSADTRVVGDLVVAHTMGNLGLNLNIDYVNDVAGGIDGFFGVAAMGRYKINDNVAIAGRGEYASVQPVTGGDRVNFQEGTLGLAFPVASRFEFRAEGRADFASQDIFVDSDGAPAGSQVTGTGAFLAWF